jgi:hypothetical protein
MNWLVFEREWYRVIQMNYGSKTTPRWRIHLSEFGSIMEVWQFYMVVIVQLAVIMRWLIQGNSLKKWQLICLGCFTFGYAIVWFVATPLNDLLAYRWRL